MTVRTINSARNPKWADQAKTQIDLEVDFDELDEVYVPFTAMANDCEPHGVTLYNNALNGDYGQIADPDPLVNVTGDDAMAEIRAIRTSLLEETDYIEFPTKWASLTPEKQSEWTTYRNALRDMPANNAGAELRWKADGTGMDWHGVTWPTKPD